MQEHRLRLCLRLQSGGLLRLTCQVRGFSKFLPYGPHPVVVSICSRPHAKMQSASPHQTDPASPAWSGACFLRRHTCTVSLLVFWQGTLGYRV